MEASALHAPAGFARGRVAIGSPLLRLRSDEQLVALFRSGDEEAFRVIHDRYRARLLAYARQMLSCARTPRTCCRRCSSAPTPACAATTRELALRAWLYRVAHNRCVDQLRRPPRARPGAAGPLPGAGAGPGGPRGGARVRSSG